MPLAPFGRALDENNLPGLNSVQRAGSNLAGFVGKLGAKLAILRTCRYCSVPERIEVETRIALLLLNSNSSAASLAIGIAARRASGRLS